MSSPLSVTRAAPQEREVLQRMLELYQHDLSDIWDQDIDGHGSFGYALDRYWSDPGCVPYIFRVGVQAAGFALVDRQVKVPGGEHWMDQFFVMKKYRGRGVGSAAASQVFRLHRGLWQVGQMTQNLPAQAFWRRAVDRFSGGNFREVQLTSGWWQGFVQSFESSGRIPGDARGRRQPRAPQQHASLKDGAKTMSQATPDSADQEFHRRIAMRCNNRAWALAEQPERAPAEDREMLDCAHASAWHWGQIGTQLHRMRCSMLLAQVHALLGHGGTALRMASEMRDYFLSNKEAPDWELAFVHAIHAHCAHVAGDLQAHSASYRQASAAMDAIADPEDREIVARTFTNVPAPHAVA